MLDAYALIAALTDEPARTEIEPLLRGHDARIATPHLVEVYDRGIRIRRFTRKALDEALDALVREGALTVLPLDDRMARRAGELRAENFHRTRSAVSLADCTAAASAEAFDEPLATQDASLANLGRKIGLEVIPLPDSSGNRP